MNRNRDIAMDEEQGLLSKETVKEQVVFGR